jgi:predicted SAM-dependent methyltransferase
MSGRLRLNLGCGFGYMPGYVNIDVSDRAVADSIGDVADLPYEPNSVDAIEASQLIEHFDLIHCRYLLAEWFRELAPGGTLGIETPDLAKTLKKLTSSKTKDKVATMQWLYGIDSPGLQHKSGFTFDLIRGLLADTGFTHIKRLESTTHTYEPGMRIECQKPERSDEAQFMAGLRKRIRQSLGFSDSYVMIPFEAWVMKIRGDIGDPTTLDRPRLVKVLSSCAPCNPKVALCVLDECVSQGLFSKRELVHEFEVMDYLVRTQFHERAFSMWAKCLKERTADVEFQKFMRRLEKNVLEILERPDRAQEITEYLMTLEPKPIEFLDICLITQLSRHLLSVGVKRFGEGKYDDATVAFSGSLDLHPKNALGYWNMARLGIATARSREHIIEEYSRAAEAASDPRVRSKIKDEAGRFEKGSVDDSHKTPICETDLVR